MGCFRCSARRRWCFPTGAPGGQEGLRRRAGGQIQARIDGAQREAHLARQAGGLTLHQLFHRLVDLLDLRLLDRSHAQRRGAEQQEGENTIADVHGCSLQCEGSHRGGVHAYYSRAALKQRAISGGFRQLIAALRAAEFAYIRCMSASMSIRANPGGGNCRYCTPRAGAARRRRCSARLRPRSPLRAKPCCSISAASGKNCRRAPPQARKCTRFPPLIRPLPVAAAHNMAGMLNADLYPDLNTFEPSTTHTNLP